MFFTVSIVSNLPVDLVAVVLNGLDLAILELSRKKFRKIHVEVLIQ
jgi:hypothetical protein